MKMLRICFLLLLLQPLLSQAQWKGKIVYSYAGGDIKQYDLSLKTDKVLFKEAQDPFVTPAGEIYFISQNFRKRNKLLRKSNAGFTQFRDVLDMTADNPLYKERLENFSVVQHRGNSAVLSSMYAPAVSPDGKYLAVNITGYADMVFDKDCVAIFEVASGNLVTRFDNKYGASWTPDNRVVMAGSYLFTSSDDHAKKGPTPGIFISDARFTGLTRIDDGLDDPSPYHPSVSPDGRQVAFVLNDHLWLMNLDGTNLHQLTAADNDNRESFPTWSPDGKYVACWSYKTFEKSYYTAVAIVSSTSSKAVVLSNSAAVWPRDAKGYRMSGGSGPLNWKYDGTVVVNPPAGPANPPKAKGPAAAVRQPAVGSKVSVKAEDGKTYTATILEIREGKYKIRYDGYDATEWLERAQFELK